MSPLKNQAIEEFNLNLEKLLKNEIKNFNSDCLSIGDIESNLEIIGIDNDDYDTNGWQNDYWKTYTLKKDKTKNILISGSGYYGGIHVSIDEKQKE